MTELLESKDVYQLRLNKTHDSMTASAHAHADQNVSYALVDEELTIITSNPRTADWSAVSVETVAGLPIQEVFPELVGTEQTLLNLLYNQADEPVETPRIHRQIFRSTPGSLGRYFDLRVATFHGTTTTLLIIIADVTDKARLEFMLNQERNELRLLMAKYKEIEQKLGK
jgi:PAS domain-containing protein